MDSKVLKTSATKLRVPHITITPTDFQENEEVDPDCVVSARVDEYPSLEVFAQSPESALELLFSLMAEMGWPDQTPDHLEAALDYGGPHITVGERVSGIQTVTQRYRRLGCIARFHGKWLWFGGSIYGVEIRQRDAIRSLVGAFGE